MEKMVVPKLLWLTASGHGVFHGGDADGDVLPPGLRRLVSVEGFETALHLSLFLLPGSMSFPFPRDTKDR